MTIRRLLLALPVLAASVLPAAVRAQSDDPSFRLNNRSGAPVIEVHVSPSDQDSWGDDLLGDNVLQPGQTLMIRIPRGQCMNDIRLTFEGGRAVEQRNIDTCRLTDVNVNG